VADGSSTRSVARLGEDATCACEQWRGNDRNHQLTVHYVSILGEKHVQGRLCGALTAFSPVSPGIGAR
jgi:hypothetical protein